MNLATSCLQHVQATTGRVQASPGAVQTLDPLQDGRWQHFARGHSRATLFHSRAWLEALSRTYDYRPVVFTTAGPSQELENGAVFCAVESWLTGRRLVCLPFSDYCDPLASDEDESAALISAIIERESRHKKWRYIEMRLSQALAIAGAGPRQGRIHTLHRLDLTPSLEEIFQNFHKSSTQRKVRRAEREKLEYREGGMEYFEDFYRLFTSARKRHGRPPQPPAWFRNLAESFGGDFKIRLSCRDGRAVATLLTLRYKDAMTYKYGGSDPQFNPLGSMHLLFWKAIQEAKMLGLRCFDFGRSEAEHTGLITFKRRWGATESVLRYLRYGDPSNVEDVFEPSAESWKSVAASSVFSLLPLRILPFAGRLLYKHVG
jgi:CelD/BcsL family acetyltransferase involved in cellulose biosynthesis